LLGRAAAAGAAALPGGGPVMTALRRIAVPAALLAVVFAVHLVSYRPSEPFFNNHETRHVMTGVFVRDALGDPGAWSAPRAYAVRYYLQHPALGLLAWPPLFYLVEGLFMLLVGPSFLAARVLVGLFAAWAGVSLYRLVLHTHDRPTAAVALLLFGL